MSELGPDTISEKDWEELIQGARNHVLESGELLKWKNGIRISWTLKSLATFRLVKMERGNSNLDMFMGLWPVAIQMDNKWLNFHGKATMRWTLFPEEGLQW